MSVAGENEIRAIQHSSVIVGADNTLVLPANSRRKYALIMLTNTTGVVLSLNKDAVTTSGILLLTTGDSYEISIQRNDFRGVINAIGLDFAGGLLFVTEGY